jgi:hypothetical protein
MSSSRARVLPRENPNEIKGISMIALAAGCDPMFEDVRTARLVRARAFFGV